MSLIVLTLVTCLVLCGSAEDIVGGQEVQPHSMPYMVFVKFKENNKFTRCGGILIRDNFVLTAAHCYGDEMSVLLGAHNIDIKESFRQDINVCNAIPHPNDKKNKQKHDIMLLKLKRKATLNRYVLPLPIVDSACTIKPGSNCTVAGWGRVNAYNDKVSSVLKAVDLSVVSTKNCSKHYEGEEIDLKEFICAGDSKKEKYSDKGDSGGPLLCGKDLCGIYYGGLKNDESVRLFTKVSTYKKWIKKTLEAKCKKQI